MIAHNIVMADMEHSVRIKHGDSSGTYQDESRDIKVVGETQGTGSAGCRWSIKSHTILWTHQELHEGIDLPHVNGMRLIQKNNDVFVDDADAKTVIEGENFYLSE